MESVRAKISQFFDLHPFAPLTTTARLGDATERRAGTMRALRSWPAAVASIVCDYDGDDPGIGRVARARALATLPKRDPGYTCLRWGCEAVANLPLGELVFLAVPLGGAVWVGGVSPAVVIARDRLLTLHVAGDPACVMTHGYSCRRIVRRLDERTFTLSMDARPPSGERGPVTWGFGRHEPTQAAALDPATLATLPAGTPLLRWRRPPSYELSPVWMQAAEVGEGWLQLRVLEADGKSESAYKLPVDNGGFPARVTDCLAFHPHPLERWLVTPPGRSTSHRNPCRSPAPKARAEAPRCP